MRNLLHETEQMISRLGYTSNDIIFIGSPVTGHRCTWTEYLTLAYHEYAQGFGAQKVASDLTILFSDGSYMVREEYDGSEGWGFRGKCKIHPEAKPIVHLFADQANQVGWVTLEEIQPGYVDHFE